MRVFPNILIGQDNTRMDWTKVRERLQHLIAARETNPTRLGEKAGVPQPTISRFLAGETEWMTLDKLASLAEALECTVSELIGERPLEMDEKIRRVAVMMQKLPEYRKDIVVSTTETLSRDEPRRPQK
jgi:DNA-binding Xre family transcriptional regulator